MLFLAIFYLINCTDLPVPAPETQLQKFTNIAKNAYEDALSRGKIYLEILQDKCKQAKDFIFEKVKNISKRGEPVFVTEDENQELEEKDEKDPLQDLSEDKLKELIDNLFKDFKFDPADFKDKKEEELQVKDEEEELEEEEKEEKAL
ncbi:putative SP-containing protein [Vairimorpha necatrix]|uniref:SP-containing protein n=1 Tax=Vairimorpha necatrix TaxID=6039 RepID=A0AAX4JD23_9MICR